MPDCDLGSPLEPAFRLTIDVLGCALTRLRISEVDVARLETHRTQKLQQVCLPHDVCEFDPNRIRPQAPTHPARTEVQFRVLVSHRMPNHFPLLRSLGDQPRPPACRRHEPLDLLHDRLPLKRPHHHEAWPSEAAEPGPKPLVDLASRQVGKRCAQHLQRFGWDGFGRWLKVFLEPLRGTAFSWAWRAARARAASGASRAGTVARRIGWRSRSRRGSRRRPREG